MLVERIGTRLMSSRHPVVNVPPVFRRNGVRLDADRFDGIDAFDPATDRLDQYSRNASAGRLRARTNLCVATIPT